MNPDIDTPFSNRQFYNECLLLKKGWTVNRFLKDGNQAELEYDFNEKGFPLVISDPIPELGNQSFTQEISGQAFAGAQIHDVCKICPHCFTADPLKGTCLQEEGVSNSPNIAVILATIDIINR